MSNPWSAFYWGDYLADTGHLTLAQHGAYLLLMAHYYRTCRPIPADPSALHRICRCATEADKAVPAQVLREFFLLDGDVYRHHRIEKEITKQMRYKGKLSESGRKGAEKRWGKAEQNGVANGHPIRVAIAEPQPQPQRTKSKARACARSAHPPALEEIRAYCQERKNHVNPEQWFDYYSARGWKLSRGAPMSDWKAAVRTWERNGYDNRNGNGKAEQREDCPLHPDSGRTNWGTCWGCYAEKHQERATA